MRTYNLGTSLPEMRLADQAVSVGRKLSANERVHRQEFPAQSRRQRPRPRTPQRSSGGKLPRQRRHRCGHVLIVIATVAGLIPRWKRKVELRGRARRNSPSRLSVSPHPPHPGTTATGVLNCQPRSTTVPRSADLRAHQRLFEALSRGHRRAGQGRRFARGN